MPVSKDRTSKPAGRKSSQAPLGEAWDKRSGPDESDGTANLPAGDKGKEPGGRWSPAYYESGPKIISGDDIRDA